MNEVLELDDDVRINFLDMIGFSFHTLRILSIDIMLSTCSELNVLFPVNKKIIDWVMVCMDKRGGFCIVDYGWGEANLDQWRSNLWVYKKPVFFIHRLDWLRLS